MSADVARWPRLKLPAHRVLDWCETKYTKETLLEMADAVGDSYIPVKGRRDAVWSTAVEKVLRALAASPAALKELNHRRPTPPARVVGLNRAVHFHVLTEVYPERKRTAIYADVGDAWGVSPGHVKADVREYAVPDPGPKDAVRSVPYRHDDAKRLMLTIVHNVCVATGRERVDVLKDFDADMRDRGATEK